MSALDPLLRPDFTPLFSFDAQISAKHEVNRFHVLQSGDDFWLRLEGHADWLGIFDNQNAEFTGVARSGDFGHLEFLLERALIERQWGRAISLLDPSDDTRFWRVLWRERKAFLMRSDTREAVAFEARTDWMRGAWIREGAHFARLLGREWRNPDLEVAAARAYLMGDDEARRLFGVEWKRGNYENLRAVARAALQIEHPGDDRELGFIQSLQGRLWTIFPEELESGRLPRVWYEAFERNLPVFSGHFAERRWAPRPFAFQHCSRQSPDIRIGIDPPSEHERLEAHLFLRDWLREHAPDLLGDWAVQPNSLP